jgi:hypothetical protein
MTSAFTLPQELTVYQSETNLTTLRQWFASQAPSAEAPLLICADAVAEVDCTGLQMLAALSSSGVYWQITEASAAFSAACHAMGLDSWLKETQVPSAKEQP